MFETIAQQVEQLLEDINRDVNEAVDVIFEWSDEVAERLNEAIAPELDQLDRQLEEWLAPFISAVTGVESTISETVQPFTQTVDPILNRHSACVGCRNYHGQVYGGTMLVCGMHPFGWEGEQCPDFESVWTGGDKA